MTDDAATRAFRGAVHVMAREAARRYRVFAQLADEAGEGALAAFFQRKAELAEMDGEEAGGSEHGMSTHMLPTLLPELMRRWDAQSPLSAWGGVFDPLAEVRLALDAALEGCRLCHAYFASIAAVLPEAGLRRSALAYAEEELAHMRALENWIARLVA